MGKFLIIDANSIINRAFYAIRPLTTKNGLNTNGIYGFLNILLKEINEEKPDFIACAFDVSRITFRTELYKEYKATRHETPQELREQFAPLKRLLSAMNIAVLEKENYEADDIIGTVSKKCSEKGIYCDILTGDKDDLQLIDDFTNVKLIITKMGKTETTRMNKEALFEKYGLTPDEMIELKALMGDKSDNIPGVKGIGEVSGLSLIKEYKNLENIYENLENIKPSLSKKLTEDKENAFLSRVIGTIKRDVPELKNIEEMAVKPYKNEELKDILKELEFERFLEKFNLKEEKEEIKINEGYPKNNENEIYYLINEDVYMLYDEKVYKFKASDESFLNSLKNEKVRKISADFKTQMHLGLEINGEICDVALMNHITDAKNKMSDFNYDIKSLKKTYESLNKKIEEDNLIYINLVEHELIKVLYEMESLGVGIDLKKLNQITDDFKKKEEEILRKIYILAGEEFNVSSPKQLGAILFEKLGLPIVKKTKTGYSTNAEVLEELSGTHEIIDFIKEYRLITKLISTYCEGFKAKKDENNILHTTYNQTLTQTGRLSSTEPNLQNIPVRSEEGRKIRSTVIPKNGLFISADYSQIELRVLSHIADDDNLKEAFINNEDIHTKTAENIFGVSDVTSDMRRAAKAINFGLIYGKGAFSLAKDLKISRKEASGYIEKYLGQYPNVKKYMTDVITDAKDNGFTKTLYGRRRYFPEFSSTNKMMIAAAERAVLNSPIQGTAADIIKIAMLNVHKKLKDSGLKSKLVLQIHDELIIDCYEDEKEKVFNLLKESMENAVDLSVPLTVSIGIGKNLDDCK